MKGSLLRRLRKTVQALGSHVQVDNVVKAISCGEWRVPFEWILDRDSLAFDVNNQRGCVICPEIAKTLTVDSIDENQNEDKSITLNIAWRTSEVPTNACPVVPTPPGSIPCVSPIRSSVAIQPLNEERQALPHVYSQHQQMMAPSTSQGVKAFEHKQLWFSPSELGESCGGLPNVTVVRNFNGKAVGESRAQVVETIEKYGFAVVEDASLARMDATTSTALVQKRSDAAEHIITSTFSFLRNSHYGAMSTWSDGDSWKEVGVIFEQDQQTVEQHQQVEFRESPSHMDGAYMSSLLDLHTDCTYFVDCPKVQAFGCIFTTPRTFGGETTLSDGMAAAVALHRHDPAAFDVLTRVPVGGRYKKEGRWYEAYRPVITMAPDGMTVANISFNNSDRIPMDLSLSTKEMKDFYEAYYKFHTLVHEQSLRFMLKPGQLLFFDNHRTLHGRLMFSGPRVMCGAYIASDEYFSTLRTARDGKNKGRNE